MITIDPTTHVSKQARANPAKPDSLRAQSPRMTAARHLHCTHQQHGGQPSSCELNRPSHSPAGPAAATTAAPTHATVDGHFFTPPTPEPAAITPSSRGPTSPLSARRRPTGSSDVVPCLGFRQHHQNRNNQARVDTAKPYSLRAQSRRVTAARHLHRTHQPHGGQPSPCERGRPSHSPTGPAAATTAALPMPPSTSISLPPPTPETATPTPSSRGRASPCPHGIDPLAAPADPTTHASNEALASTAKPDRLRAQS